MKKFVMGLIVGIVFATAASVYAEDGLQKVEAYLRPGLPITLDGKTMTLDSPPVMYDGSTYLKLRDVTKLTGMGVTWNDASQTVELTTTPTAGVKAMAVTTTPTFTTFNDIKAMIVNGTTYYSPADYYRKKNVDGTFSVKDGKITIHKKTGDVEITISDTDAVQIYNGETFINVKNYPE